MKILITGGAGYIGSHTALYLKENTNFEIAVLDNLSYGHKEAINDFPLFKGNIGDTEFVSTVLSQFKPDAVLHFAAFIQVGESVKKPFKYYKNNFINTALFLEQLVKHNIKYFIFSSTAAVYGTPKNVPIKETTPLHPINPYGKSKMFVEQLLQDLTMQFDFRYVALRYFNAAGADPKGRIGESHNPETHLIPLVLKTAKGEREKIYIFGTDYPTPDGTAIRDYIHVTDLADAHYKALLYLFDKGKSDVYNCGYGKGYSVKEVIDTAKKVTGVNFTVEEAPRRPGDAPTLVADSTKLQKTLNWLPKYDNLEFIIKTAWNWELRRRF